MSRGATTKRHSQTAEARPNDANMEVRVESKIAVLLAHELPLARRSITDLLNSSPNLEVCLSATPTQPQERQLPSATPAASPTPIRDYRLTRRELEIVRAIGNAITNKNIAVQLHISEYTV